MKKSELIHLKNEMLSANLLANFVSVFLVNTLMVKAESPIADYNVLVVNRIDMMFTFGAFVFVIILTLFYERPIRRYLRGLFERVTIPQDVEIKARSRLLNEPFFIIAVDLGIWLLAAIVYPMMFWVLDAGSYSVQRVLFIALSNGLITITLAFFLLEHVLQKRLTPYFFPNGGLYAVPKTIHIRIRTRLIALLLACNIIPLFSIIQLHSRITHTQQIPAYALERLHSAIFINASIFMGLAICLTMLVSRNMTLPFKEIIQTLRLVRSGRFDKKVQVTTNDEIGYTGDVINEMTEGLIERDRMQQSLDLAREVQLNLLPKEDLNINGFEIAGKSVYCDETGGDYYDFINMDEEGGQKIGVVIGDVSGHGIPSALLMATVRAFLRQRASNEGSTARIISDVNRQLARDVEDSGQFMTMFFLTIDAANKQIEWVRAGHDPAIIYDPATDSFEELGGPGMALGVDQECIYKDNKKYGLSKGQIICLGTDGIWEVRNKKGEMLGKEPIVNGIRENSALGAKQILDAIFNTVDKFLSGAKKEDDITSVIIKIQD
jgi:sigma-B regulation protein RsbU (phosphoserine phosphatase)